MKYASFKIAAMFSAIVLFSPARADYLENSDTYYDTARVLSSAPVYKSVSISTPRQECRQVSVPAYDGGHDTKSYKSYTPLVLGSVVGAAVGSRFGQGTGKTVGTIAGGILGGSVARDVQYRYGKRVSDWAGGHNSGYATSRTTTKCTTVNDVHNEEKLDGYRVKYRYNGRVYQTRTDTDPGRDMRVKVSVIPDEF